MLTCQPPHVDFWQHHKERAQFLFIEQARAEPAHQMKYIGHQLVPDASASVQKLLDCFFIKNVENRPRSDDLLRVFDSDASFTHVTLSVSKLNELKSQIDVKEKCYSDVFKAIG